jgi:membrane protease YdiL (CAAX protease family)
MSENNINDKFPIRFFVVTILWSWLFFLPLILNGYGIISINKDILPVLTPLIIIIGAFGPTIGVCYSLFTLNGKESIKEYFKSFLSLKFGWKAWLSIFLILGIPAFLAWIIPEFFGQVRFPSYLPNPFLFPIYLIFCMFLGGGQEEIGWRGYIMPYLEKKYGIIISPFIFGIIWAIWHIPLWFIPGSTQVYMNFFGFILMTIGYSYIFEWIIKISGKRLLSGLVSHGTANAFSALFPFLVMDSNAIQIRFWIYCIFIFIIGIIIVVLRSYKKIDKT